MLPPSPLDLGSLFTASFQALKQRFGLFVLLALLPSLAFFAVFALGIAVMVPGIVAVAQGNTFGVLPAGFVGGFVILIVGSILVGLLQLKSYGMMSLAAYEIAQGQRPDFNGLWTRNRGFLPAMAAVIGIVIGAVVALQVLMAAVLFGAYGAGSRSNNGAVAGLGILLVFLLFFALIPLILFLTVKFLYTVPAVAVEHIGGVDGLKRSWSLTRGSFWRTLGYYLVASFAASAVSGVVSAVSQGFVSFPMSSRSSDPAEAVTVLLTMAPVILVSFGLQMVVQVVAAPFLQAYLTYMFIDQVRRSQLPTPMPYGGTQGYYGQPGSGYGQPGSGYGQPGSGYGQPGPGYGQPGSGYGQPGSAGTWQYPTQAPQRGWTQQYPSPQQGSAQQGSPQQGSTPQYPSQSPQPDPTQQYPPQGWLPPGQNPPDRQG